MEGEEFGCQMGMGVGKGENMISFQNHFLIYILGEGQVQFFEKRKP